MLQYGTLWSNRIAFNAPPSPSSPATPLSPSSSSHSSSSHDFKHPTPSSPSPSPSSSTIDLDHHTIKDHHPTPTLQTPQSPPPPPSTPPPTPPPSSPSSSSDDPQHHQTLEKARKAGKYLQLLLHCQRCYGECNNPVMCKHAKLLCAHSSRCSFNANQCPIAGCHQTKRLLQHYTLCRWERKNAKLSGGNEIKECLMCSFVEMSHQDHHPHRSHSPHSQSPLPSSPQDIQRENSHRNPNFSPQQQQRFNHSLDTIPHDHEFAIPLPPKRLRASYDPPPLNNQHYDEEREGEEEDDEISRLQQTRYRSVSHAPDHLGLTSRSTRTGSI